MEDKNIITRIEYGQTVTRRPWDGTSPETWHRYPVEKMQNKYYIDQNGNIDYMAQDGTFKPWCSRQRLRQHLTRLYQLGVAV